MIDSLLYRLEHYNDLSPLLQCIRSCSTLLALRSETLPRMHHTFLMGDWEDPERDLPTAEWIHLSLSYDKSWRSSKSYFYHKLVQSNSWLIYNFNEEVWVLKTRQGFPFWASRKCFVGGENGFNQAIELSADTLANVKFVMEKRLISKFFDEISQDTGKFVFGVKDTLNCLDMGAVETLIVWENLDCTRHELRDSQTGETLHKNLTAAQVPTNHLLHSHAHLLCNLPFFTRSDYWNMSGNLQ